MCIKLWLFFLFMTLELLAACFYVWLNHTHLLIYFKMSFPPLPPIFNFSEHLECHERHCKAQNIHLHCTQVVNSGWCWWNNCPGSGKTQLPDEKKLWQSCKCHLGLRNFPVPLFPKKLLTWNTEMLSMCGYIFVCGVCDRERQMDWGNNMLGFEVDYH